MQNPSAALRATYRVLLAKTTSQLLEYFVFQEEQGVDGAAPHFQLYAEFNGTSRPHEYLDFHYPVTLTLKLHIVIHDLVTVLQHNTRKLIYGWSI